jgi:DNA polymerase III delta prime subunit
MPGIFISYRREDSAGVAGRLFDRLSQRFGKKNVFRDIDSVPGGTKFARDIAERIETCDALIALIGKNWLDARDREGRRRLDQPGDYVVAEISEALHQHKLVIPVLIEDTPMPSRDALPEPIASLPERNALPLSDRRFDYDVGVLIATIGPTPDEAARRESNEQDLIAEVRHEIANRLAQSLPNELSINVLKLTQPHQVQRPWDTEIKVARQRSTLLPPQTQVIEVFDQEETAGKVLILGPPGSGKTTTLLELAGELIARAAREPELPIPVLLNLSSWRQDAQDLARWMEAELKLKYGLRPDISQQWLNERRLVPLLDGLDELEPGRQEKCVQAINQFLLDYRPKKLVVCCRVAEYQSLTHKLQLNSAICLQPLTYEQIRDYLASTGHRDFWASIETDPELIGMASSPLLLSIMTIVYEGQTVEGAQQFGSPSERNRYLFDLYIERMLSREVKGENYPREKALLWLSWLAVRLKQYGQPEFLIEKLQPAWLQSGAQKWIYHILVMSIVALVLPLFLWLVQESLMQFAPGARGPFVEKILDLWQEIGLPAWSLDVSVAVTIGLIAGLIVGLKREIQPIETLRWSSSKARDGMVLGLRRWSMAGLKYGACMALIAGLIYSIFDLDVGQPDDLALWRRGGQILGAISGASAVVFTLLVCSGGSSWIRLRGRLRTASIDGLTSALIVGIGWALSFGIRGEAAWHIVLWFLLTGLSVGAIAALGHGLRNRLPFRMTDVLIVALIGWVMSGLGTWFISTLIYDAPSQLRDWMSFWLSGWLGVAVTVGSVAALIATIREKERSGDLVQSG